jgi:nucleoside-diphosphate-sugar epimerase
MSLHIIGCGYVGRMVAGEYLQRKTPVHGVVHSPESAGLLQELGIAAHTVDLDGPDIQDLSLAGTQLFYFAPPPPQGETDTRVRNLIAAFEHLGHPARIVYLSTTGVYGDCHGEWVDETRPPAPTVPRALRRWDAEQAFMQWREQSGNELIILRVAGIYGPGKLPLERLRKGLPLVQESEAPYSNRIHAADLVQVCMAAMERGRDGERYNVSDGHPSTMTDYFNRLADLASLPRPPLISLAEGEQQLSAGMMSYMHESRRLDNRKMLQELEVELRYPDLGSGLAACFDESE